MSDKTEREALQRDISMATLLGDMARYLAKLSSDVRTLQDEQAELRDELHSMKVREAAQPPVVKACSAGVENCEAVHPHEHRPEGIMYV